MTEPTDADRKHAAELIWGTRPQDQVEAVARALADARAEGAAEWAGPESLHMAPHPDDWLDENTP